MFSLSLSSWLDISFLSASSRNSFSDTKPVKGVFSETSGSTDPKNISASGFSFI